MMKKAKKKNKKKALKTLSPKRETPQKKKLLIATDNFLPRWDGISRFLSEIIPRLRYKYDITVIAPDFGQSSLDDDESVNIVKIPITKFRIGDFKPAKFHHRTIRREVKRADIVFSQTIGPIGILSIFAAKRNKKKIISFIHSIEWELVSKAIGLSLLSKYIRILTKIIARKIYNKADLLIVPSENIAEMLTWQKIKTKKKVIHLGVDTKKFVPTNNKISAKKKLGIDPAFFVIGHHGRLGREKDLATLLRAYILVKKKHPKTLLIVVGEGLDSIKKKLKSVPGVILPGSTNNVVPHLQAMDVYCLTSLTETTSLTTLEAMSCGVPVIATRVGFVKHYIKPRINGLFFKEGNSFDLANQIMYLMKQEVLKRKISLEARKTVEKEFSWDKTAKKIEETIEEII
ncbi:MAG TPA: glycosyltransferase family 1 protein [Candidatus Woesearchaeota archaeon]|nr:glycosyltransferase family 1 protein [Candidatus Woesearchaeota archaeon]